MRRRQFLGTVGSVALASGVGPSAGPAFAATPYARQKAGPPTVTPDDLDFRPRTLRPGSPQRAGLLPGEVARMVPAAEEYMRPGPDRPHPSHPGFVLLAARNGIVVEHAARGHALRYASWDASAGKPVELPRDEWVPMREDTLFDMASVSKLFTSIVLVSQAEKGAVDLDAPVARLLPEFAASDPAKSRIVVRQLVNHTSGMQADIDLQPYPDNKARLAAIYKEPLENAPGEKYTYSDLNLITAGRMLEKITGKGLDELVAEVITEPLGMTDTGYNPPKSKLERIAATEYMPWTGRGMVRGSVHDEKAYYLGGVAGHAGVFSTAADMAVFGQMVLNGGTYGGHRVLGEKWVRAMITNENAGMGEDAARGLGWQLDQRFYMDALTSPVTTGHTGYTGPCLVADPIAGTLFVLLTNRVHPTRDWGTVSDYRRAPARHLARAVPVRPAVAREAWYAGQRDEDTGTLRVPLREPVRKDAALRFQVWYDTQPTDVCTVEATTDARPDDDAAWRPVPLKFSAGRHSWDSKGDFAGFSARRWLHAEGALPDGVTGVRWRYVTDEEQQGRGVYLDDIRVLNGRRPVFSSVRPRDNALVRAEGWKLSRD
ncbi:CubicO group peptidase (beta-lactamase class C family) [Streptomyces sp. Amel2xB2]|uniref:serine hydrolase domain-containing protein n=1 Tax=Streptomyces sp. Amel2xB2 TaxID=1305829 RepID=UPI000DB915D6|nr:serine hydrolase domain-containing protein [Streptomyces sp. Amel2xB2]RAJ71551.1 CubicO group peptidase (beta-lactamase class C family) [Streptomyces sp. Amel2xB2]